MLDHHVCRTVVFPRCVLQNVSGLGNECFPCCSPNKCTINKTIQLFILKNISYLLE